jgi:hypothetical protein
MGSKILTLVMGFILIITSGIQISDKPVDVNYQITVCSVGIIMCCASFTFFIMDKLEEIKEKIKK